MTQLRKATRSKAKIRLGLSSVSGGGKTYSAILIAKGMYPLTKVAIIDTEEGSADLYADMGDYNVLTLKAPFTPEKYIKAIDECVAANMELIIIDSITHEWDGKGGCLEIQQALGGEYRHWASVTPRHQAFVNAITQCPVHVITTVRRKQDYEIVQKSNGKSGVNKLGLKEVTRDGFEYELTANLEIEMNHHATASKDRTGLFMGKPAFIPSEETGRMIMEWCEAGVEPAIKDTRQELSVDHELFYKVKDAVAKGQRTIFQITEKFILTRQALAELENSVPYAQVDL
jgi:hypothetical protein